MKNFIYNKCLKILLLCFAPLLLASCNGENGESFPQVADPPPFDYVDGEELRSGMHRLAFAMLTLDRELAGLGLGRELADENEEDPIDQRAVVESLEEIKQVAESLQEGNIRSAHPYLAKDMFRFLSDVDQALWQASLRSPRYYMAGRVSGACTACHRAVEM